MIPAGQRWWKAPAARWLAAVVLVLGFPVRLTVLAPGELVPANPAMIRAPLDGVVGQFFVKPNQVVKAGQPLFEFDQAPIAARAEVAAQSLATAEAEYRKELERHPDASKASFNLAQLYEKAGNRTAQVATLKQAVEQNSNFAEGKLFLAKAYLDSGINFPEAENDSPGIGLGHAFPARRDSSRSRSRGCASVLGGFLVQDIIPGAIRAGWAGLPVARRRSR